jgi:K(+)-stimulated pyrophosphate-energized sodium pump
VSVWLFGRVSGVEHPLGLWLAVVSGVLTAWGITSTSDWFTSDHFKAVKEVARQAQTGVPGVILSGLSAGLWAAVISFVLTSLGVAAAYGAGLWAIADGGGLYGLAVAAVGASAAVPMALTAIAGRRAGTEMDMDEGSRLAAETATALDADPRSFSLATATMTAVAFLAVLLSLDMGSGIHLATGVGLLLGVVLPFAVTGFLLIGAGRTLGPVESIMPAAGAVALTVILGFVDWVGLLAFLGGWLAVGFLLTTILLNAGMAWAAARSFVELGAFGGEGSSAHGWVVTAEALGRSLVQRSATSLTLELKVTMTLAVVLAGAGWPWPG